MSYFTWWPLGSLTLVWTVDIMVVKRSIELTIWSVAAILMIQKWEEDWKEFEDALWTDKGNCLPENFEISDEGICWSSGIDTWLTQGWGVEMNAWFWRESKLWHCSWSINNLGTWLVTSWSTLTKREDIFLLFVNLKPRGK